MATLVSTIVAAFIAAIGAVISTYVQNDRHYREVDLKFVELAIGILSKEFDQSHPLKRWAVDIIDMKSPRRFTDEERFTLINLGIVGGDRRGVPVKGIAVDVDARPLPVEMLDPKSSISGQRPFDKAPFNK